MKNIFLLLSVAVCSTFISCNSGGGMSATAKKNLEVNDDIMKAYEAGDFGKMGDYIAADAIDHGGEKGDVKGLENIVSQMKLYREQMPDMKSTMTRSLADDEYVYTWAKMSGTMGGKQTEMSSVDVSKFKDGKAVEHWIYMDPKEVMQMMQSMPAPAVDTMATK
jgi:predicted SnoaL-like aldol condensation-catalyzing enzyme